MPGASIAQLEASGVVTVIGTVVNPAGLTHVKAVPIRRAKAFAEDIYGPAELHYLGAQLWRGGITHVLQGFVDADQWSAHDAIRVVDLIAHRNADRIYALS